MKQRIQRKFEAWRQEPAEVRLRIATLLTAVSGAVMAALWLFILLPLQLHLSAPTEPGVVSGIRNVIPLASPTATPSPSPTPYLQQ